MTERAASLRAHRARCADNLIRNELDLPMAFCGIKDICQVDRSILLPATCPSAP